MIYPHILGFYKNIKVKMKEGNLLLLLPIFRSQL